MLKQCFKSRFPTASMCQFEVMKINWFRPYSNTTAVPFKARFKAATRKLFKDWKFPAGKKNDDEHFFLAPFELKVSDIELFATTVNNLMGWSINFKRGCSFLSFYFGTYYFNLRHVFDLVRPFVQSQFHCSKWVHNRKYHSIRWERAINDCCFQSLLNCQLAATFNVDFSGRVKHHVIMYTFAFTFHWFMCSHGRWFKVWWRHQYVATIRFDSMQSLVISIFHSVCFERNRSEVNRISEWEKKAMNEVCNHSFKRQMRTQKMRYQSRSVAVIDFSK